MSTETPSTKIEILIYEGFTALDAIGPYEVLSRLPGASLTFVAERPEPLKTDNGMLTLVPGATLDASRAPDIVLVPGGPGEAVARNGGAVLDWLREVAPGCRHVVSVCTGSLILAAAGLLEGRRATGHWLAMEKLRELGADAVSERVVFDEPFVTAAGVSAGIDMALALAAREAGPEVAQAIQLGIEYAPEPPFQAGSPRTAPPEIVGTLRSLSRFVA